MFRVNLRIKQKRVTATKENENTDNRVKLRRRKKEGGKNSGRKR